MLFKEIFGQAERIRLAFQLHRHRQFEAKPVAYRVPSIHHTQLSLCWLPRAVKYSYVKGGSFIHVFDEIVRSFNYQVSFIKRELQRSKVWTLERPRFFPLPASALNLSSKKSALSFIRNILGNQMCAK